MYHLIPSRLLRYLPAVRLSFQCGDRRASLPQCGRSTGLQTLPLGSLESIPLVFPHLIGDAEKKLCSDRMVPKNVISFVGAYVLRALNLAPIFYVSLFRRICSMSRQFGAHVLRPLISAPMFYVPSIGRLCSTPPYFGAYVLHYLKFGAYRLLPKKGTPKHY